MAGPGVTRDGNFFSIVGIQEDWTPELIFGVDGLFVDIKIKRIELRGGADAKGMKTSVVIREGGTAGPVICTLSTTTPYTPDRCYFDDGGMYMKPFLDYADSLLPFTNVEHILIFEVA